MGERGGDFHTLVKRGAFVGRICRLVPQNAGVASNTGRVGQIHVVVDPRWALYVGWFVAQCPVVRVVLRDQAVGSC